MSTQKQEFHSYNSPWTEIYDMHCQHETLATGTATPQKSEEQEPTQNALADVYNRNTAANNHSKRF